ncbi:hypothetical protein KAR50_08350 [Periweissella fabaria]|uniref:Cell surface protein n=1 Tax=Periweissella fabaria TaxID=546157 RepID=A0ABM8Z7N4_9LACO|nr:hypothetical protein [Periweissella fabaria]MCM0597847.1 hypothetical protein [Periweissella fabaria]CAH0417296.1 hypothetical protein WFA24289_01628 [Periweissella fabaria]
MKSLKKVFVILVGLVVAILFIGGSVQNTIASSVSHSTSAKIVKTPATPQIITQKIQGSWYFFDNKGQQHKVVITGNTFQLDNKTATVNKDGFIYYAADGIYQLGYNYSDNGYAFKTKVQKVNGKAVNTLQMISANFAGTNVLTQGTAHHFGAQAFF